jgi:hypothetical protein
MNDEVGSPSTIIVCEQLVLGFTHTWHDCVRRSENSNIKTQKPATTTGYLQQPATYNNHHHSKVSTESHIIIRISQLSKARSTVNLGSELHSNAQIGRYKCGFKARQGNLVPRRSSPEILTVSRIT